MSLFPLWSRCTVQSVESQYRDLPSQLNNEAARGRYLYRTRPSSRTWCGDRYHRTDKDWYTLEFFIAAGYIKVIGSDRGCLAVGYNVSDQKIQGRLRVYG